MKISSHQLSQFQNFKFLNLFKSNNKSLWLVAFLIALGITTIGLNIKDQSPIKKQLNVNELKVGDKGIVRGLIVSKKSIRDNPNQKLLTLQTDSGIQVNLSGSPRQLDEIGIVGEFVEISADVSSSDFLSNPRLLKKGQSNKDSSSMQNIQIFYEEESEYSGKGQYLIRIQSHGELIPLYLSGKLKARLNLGNKYELSFVGDVVQCIRSLDSENKVCN